MVGNPNVPLLARLASRAQAVIAARGRNGLLALSPARRGTLFIELTASALTRERIDHHRKMTWSTP
jgi:hypothetical protein